MPPVGERVRDPAALAAYRKLYEFSERLMHSYELDDLLGALLDAGVAEGRAPVLGLFLALAGSVLHFIDNWRQGREKIIFSLDNAIKAAENAGQMYREADGAIAKSARGED